jgi:hypothetical protein
VSGELLVEIERAGVGWTDISDKVYTRAPLTVGRGRSDEDSNAAPSRLSLTLDNRDGRFSPRNPLSPYYGQLGRNTKIRVGVQETPVYDAYSNSSGTGDLSWTHTPTGDPTGVCVFVWQYNTSGGSIASVTYGGVAMERKIFGLFTLGAVQAVGYMYFLNRLIPTGAQTVVIDTTATVLRQASAITITGGTNTEVDATSTAYSSASPSADPLDGITTFKPAMILGSLLSDLNDGSTISAGSGYTQLGEHDIGTETVSVERSDVQTVPGGYNVRWTAASAHWGIMAVAIRCVNYLFWGEVASLPPRWDPSGTDAYVPVESNGVLRRYGQGTAPAVTGLRDYYTLVHPSNLACYYPLSGGEGTTYSLNQAPFLLHLETRFFPQPALGLFGDVIQSPVFTYGRDMGAAWLGTGMELNATGNAYMRGDVRTGDNAIAFEMVFQAVPPGLGVLQIQLEDYNVRMWNLILNTDTDDGTLQVTFDDPNVGPIGFLETDQIPELLDTRLHHLRFQLTTDGPDTDYAVYIDGTLVDDGTMAGYTLNGCSLFRLFYTRYTDQTVMNIAHLAVWGNNVGGGVIPDVDDVVSAAFGYVGETAGDRLDRVAELASWPITVVGDNADTTAMGAQYEEPTLTQIRDAENADFGILTEARDALSLLYRSRSSMYNQDPVITIDYSAGELSPPFEPVDDDQRTRNDVTASRRDGDSFRATRLTGPLSVEDPPDGVGRYQDERQVNVQTDAMLPGIAQWLLNAGTLDQARYPSVVVNLLAPAVAANAALSAGLWKVDVGDTIRITGLEAVGIYGDVDLIVLGDEKVVGPVEKTFTFNCMPAAPYQVAVYDTDRYDTDGSELVFTVGTLSPSLSVAATGTSLWTTDVSAFPFDIHVGGERMTVTGITGTSSPQTLSVTRSVNGVVKSHEAGTEVRLWKTPRYAL